MKYTYDEQCSLAEVAVSCASEAWRFALVNQAFVQQQDPISSRWRPRERSWGQAQGLGALRWTPDQAKGLKQ
ncbi:hypothetical protein SRHO_G00034950 [Serrasalmus rhombeus]